MYDTNFDERINLRNLHSSSFDKLNVNLPRLHHTAHTEGGSQLVKVIPCQPYHTQRMLISYSYYILKYVSISDLQGNQKAVNNYSSA